MTGPRLQLDASAMALMVVLCACRGVKQVANSGISPVLQAGLRAARANRAPLVATAVAPAP
ncbi:MAG TPA: hypothetical protein VGP50_07590 [Stellaceae bacterium]|jgi:hypothetical protein|nr:hypothetical protein [Stellaceae bacterium]